MTAKEASKKVGRPKKDGEKSQYSIRAVERAAEVLSAFSVQQTELTLGEIAKSARLSKPTAFRILHTLEANRFVSYDQAISKYRLGSKLLELGGIALSSLTLRKAARPHLNRLNSATGATVLLGVIMDEHLVYVDKREGMSPIRVVSDIGWRREPHFGMLGRTMMAYMREEEVRALLARFPLLPHNRYTITDLDKFFGSLAEVRKNGVIIEVNEAIEGLWGVAAPVYDVTRKVIAAVGASLPVSEHSEQRVAGVVAAVREAARNISTELGYVSPTY